MRPEQLQPLDEFLAGEVELLVDVLQAVGGDRLDADQGAEDAGLAHRVQELGVLGRLHRDLGVEHQVARQLLHLGHQLEALVPQGLQLVVAGLVLAPVGHAQVFEGDGIEVVVGEGDEPETHAPQLDDLFDDRVHRPLARLLAVGAPHRAERAVLGAPPHGLDRRPHVVLALQQVPARGLERAGVHLAGVVDALRFALGAILQDRAPGEVAVALDRRVGAAALVRLVRIERRVDAAVHDPRPPLARPPAERVADQGVAGVDADAHDVAGLDPADVERLEALVDQDRIAPLAGRRRREHVQPAGGDDGHAEREMAGVDDEYAHGILPGSCLCRRCGRRSVSGGNRGFRPASAAAPSSPAPGRAVRQQRATGAFCLRDRAPGTGEANPTRREPVNCRPGADQRQPPGAATAQLRARGYAGK